MKKAYDLFKELHSSPGMTYLNRRKIRLFSVNIFLTNWEELKKACEVVENPDIGIKLMSDQELGRGVQAHREVNRLFHNFLASAQTLVEHTRSFTRINYDKTPFKQSYDQKIENEFSSDGLCRFIQDLRNYMLHKGLPDSSMSLTVTKRDLGSGHDLNTTVSLNKVRLLEWSGWSKEAKQYISTLDKQIKISDISNLYGEKILELSKWYEKKMEKHHSDDIMAFEKLQKEYRLLEEKEEEERNAT